MNKTPFESTYALLVRSEEKQRSRFEIFIYMLLIVSTTFASRNSDVRLR